MNPEVPNLNNREKLVQERTELEARIVLLSRQHNIITSVTNFPNDEGAQQSAETLSRLIREAEAKLDALDKQLQG